MEKILDIEELQTVELNYDPYDYCIDRLSQNLLIKVDPTALIGIKLKGLENPQIFKITDFLCSANYVDDLSQNPPQKVYFCRDNDILYFDKEYKERKVIRIPDLKYSQKIIIDNIMYMFQGIGAFQAKIQVFNLALKKM